MIKKIALIDPIGTKSGMDSYSTGLLPALEELGVETFLYSNFIREDQPKHSFAFFSNSIDHKLSGILLYPLRYIRVIRHAKRMGCSSVILHVFHFNRMDEWTIRKVKAQGMQAIVIVHDVESFVDATNELRLKRICEQWADILIVHSKFVSDELVEVVSKVAEKKVHIIPHGHFLSLASKGLDKAAARERLGLQKSKGVVLFFGMIKPTKGLDVLLRSWKTVQADASLIIAGRLRNLSFSPFQKIIDDELSGKNIQLMIRQISNEERDLLFRAADIVVLPYTRIYQSGVLLMAMSYGLPVIVSRLKGFEEQILHEKNGLLVEPGNHVRLGKAIDLLLSDQAMQNRLSEEGLKSIHVYHDWKKIAVQFKEILS